jgi:aminopeptidase-like protein
VTGGGILALTRDLCRFATGVVAPENERLFARIAEELPITVHRYPSGATTNGWVVPELWRVRRARVLREGREVFDAASHPLGVAVYSRPFSGELDLGELRRHVVTSEEHPGAYVYHCVWQYRPWAADWALSVPHEVLRTFAPGRYRVELETTYEQGEMLVADYEHRGRSDRTVVLNAHTCHPQMANDDFAGVAVLVRLLQWLQGRDTFYTYRLVLGPEHLGSVFYLADQTTETLERFVCGAFAEMPGTQAPVKVASSFLGGQPVDKAFRNAARHYAEAFETAPWRCGAGNDEVVWEAPGYEVPFVEVSRAESFARPFAGYHTSLDTPELLDERRLEEFAEVFRRAVEALEQNAVAHRLFDGLVALSNPLYDLYQERPDPAVEKDLAPDSEAWGRLMDSIQRYFDGSLTVLDIAQKHDLAFADVQAYLRRFEEKGLVRLERAPIERLPISSSKELAQP